MWRSCALLLGIVYQFTAQPAVAQPVNSHTTPLSGGLVYYWERVPNSHKHELYVSGYRIGVYDPETRIYQRINADGTLSGPAAPPWKLPPDPNEKTEKATEAEEPKEETPAGNFFSRLPPWTGYAVGAVVTLLLTILGIAMQVRRQ
jgi:hypothetical protein